MQKAGVRLTEAPFGEGGVGEWTTAKIISAAASSDLRIQLRFYN